MADFELVVAVDAENPIKHDLKLVDGQLLLVSDSRDSIAQHLRIRLQFFLAEWFLDQREGLPFFRDILVKNPSMPLLRSIFRRTILETPGIESLDKFRLVIDTARIGTLDFTAVLTSGEVLTAADLGLPFVLEGL